ncbi:Glandicoline B O-methyltransferase roqN [Colletotrichum tropicale]|nr:Glandicoline B O-methyltransferase roqN [Colletotrichum tropicale]
MESYSAAGPNAPGQSKLFLNPAGINPPADRANHTSLWRRTDVGNIYRNTEYITAPVTPPLLEHCGLTGKKIASLQKPVEVLDMCCGAGVVSAHIQAMIKEQGREKDGVVRLTCSDSSEAQLQYVKERIKVDGWVDAKTVHADIACLPFPSNSFDYIVVGMALMVVADPYTGLSELQRVLKPGGRIATSTWAYEGWVPATREAVADLRLPGQKPVPWPQESHQLTRIWSPGAWEDEYFTCAMYNAAGFVDAEAKTVTKNITFETPEQFCAVLQGLELGVTERYWSKEQKEKLRPKLTATIIEYLNKKYGGKQFETERTAVFASATKPLE